MRRVSAPDLVGFPTQRQGDDDQVAGGALDQGRARAGPVLADDRACSIVCVSVFCLKGLMHDE